MLHRWPEGVERFGHSQSVTIERGVPGDSGIKDTSCAGSHDHTCLRPGRLRRLGPDPRERQPLENFGIEYDPVHLNSEFADQASEHDPKVARLDSKGRPTPG